MHRRANGILMPSRTSKLDVRFLYMYDLVYINCFVFLYTSTLMLYV